MAAVAPLSVRYAHEGATAVYMVYTSAELITKVRRVSIRQLPYLRRGETVVASAQGKPEEGGFPGLELEEPTGSSAEFGCRVGGHAQVSLRRDHTAPRSKSRRLIPADTGRLMMQKQCSTKVPSANWCSISTMLLWPPRKDA